MADHRRSSFDSFAAREQMYPPPRPSGPATPLNDSAALQAKEDGKLRQVIPRFFTKAALTIVSSRIDLPPALSADTGQVKSNSWFNLVLDETDALNKDLAPWARLDPISSKPSPLVIELYLDTADLDRNQTLVVVDERGRRWDVCEALAPPVAASANSHEHRRPRNTQIVLERWRLSLDASTARSGSAETVSNAYKKAVVLFRSLYTYLRFLPAWKFTKKVAQSSTTLKSLRPLFRIRSDDPSGQPRDSLAAALYPSADLPYEKHVFQSTYTTAGSLCIEVSYRQNCDFRVDESEAILSSHFLGLDNQYFRPSLGHGDPPDLPMLAGGREVGSLPADKRVFKDRQDLSQAYGSMSTFHNLDARPGTSPISALRQVRDLRSESPTSHSPPPPSSLRRDASFASLKSRPAERLPHRPSSSLAPAADLTSSPQHIPTNVQDHADRGSSPRTPSLKDAARPISRAFSGTPPTAAIDYHRRQPSLNTAYDPSGRSVGAEVAVGSPLSSSPRAPPIARYSSSFGHRRARLSTDKGSGGAASVKLVEEDASSSGRASQTSNQPGSGLLLDNTGEQGSSSSQQTDEDNISDFLKSLEKSKDLRSFNRNDDAAREASTRRTAAALSRYQRQRDSNSVLGDSISSSIMLHRSSSASSKQLPPGLVGASVSTSSSPGKPLSPHTPHTPAIPSRLSAQRTAEDHDERSRSRHMPSASSLRQSHESEESARAPSTALQGPIDIPTSPRNYPYVVRRSSSAAQRGRDSAEDRDIRGQAPASLPMEAAADLSLSELFALPQPPPPPHGRTRRADALHDDGDHDGNRSPVAGSVGRGRFARGPGGLGPGLGSRHSRDSQTGRRSTEAPEDDEPLLFAMSELEAGEKARRT